MQKYNLQFLREFTKHLVIQSLPKDYLEIEKTEEEKILSNIKEINENFEHPIHKKENYSESIKHTEEIPMKKIEPMINDNKVKSIESPGPGKYLIVTTPGGKIPSNIILTREDINKIIETFSIKSRIPIIGGIFKAIVDNLVISGINHEASEPRFIITKIMPKPMQKLQKK